MLVSMIKKHALSESVSTWFSWNAMLKQCDFTLAFQKNKFTKGLLLTWRKLCIHLCTIYVEIKSDFEITFSGVRASRASVLVLRMDRCWCCRVLTLPFRLRGVPQIF